MSYPQRVFDLAGLDRNTAIFLHRLINIGMVTAGLYFFVRLFDTLKIRRLHTNITLIITTSLPIFVLIAATVNYDNALFLLAPIFFLFFVRIVKSKEVNWYDLATFMFIGMVASLVKFTFLQLFATAALILIILLLQRHKKNLFARTVTSFSSTTIRKKVPLLVLLAVITFLFLQTYVVNFVQYGTPRPSCERTLSEERCKKSGIIRRNLSLQATISEREEVNFPDYALRWTRGMVTNASQTGVVTSEQKAHFGTPIPIYISTLFISMIVGSILLAYAWRALNLSVEVKLLMFLAISYVLTILIQNLSLYHKYHANIAIHSRYVLIVAPIIIILMVLAAQFATRKSKNSQVFITIVFILLLSQGGWAVTHILRSDETWYRDNQTVQKANELAKRVLRPLVKEH